jgi:hypothetical protein
MRYIDRRVLIRSSGILLVTPLLASLFNRRSSAFRVTATPLPRRPGPSKELFGFANRGVGEAVTKIRGGGVQVRDLLSAEEKIRLAAEHFAETDLDSAFAEAASNSDFSSLDVSGVSYFDKVFSLVRAYASSVAYADLVPPGPTCRRQLENVLNDICHNGLSVLLFKAAADLNESIISLRNPFRRDRAPLQASIAGASLRQADRIGFTVDASNLRQVSVPPIAARLELTIPIVLAISPSCAQILSVEDLASTVGVFLVLVKCLFAGRSQTAEIERYS